MGDIINPIQSDKHKFFLTSYSNPRDRLLIISFWIAGFAIGAWQVWVGRYHMSADGMSYIDVADAYMRGDWNTAINGFWSPLYSWIIGLALAVLKPSPYSEFIVVHFVNLLIYVFTIGCFHLFIMQLVNFHRTRPEGVPQDRSITFPEWAWISLGYCLFLETSLVMIGVWEESPDMLVAAFVFLVSGIILRIRNGMKSYRSYASLGAALGFGYLAKAAMFPMAFVFLPLSAFSMGNLKKALPRALLALIIFLIVAGPFIAALSKARGRITFGDAGTYSYWFHVNSYSYFHWDGTPPGSGTPTHPPRKIYDNPAIYEFGTPFKVSYPLWYDPTYWNDGLKTRIDLKEQLEAIKRSLKTYYPIFYPGYSVMIFGSLILYLMGGRRRLVFADIMKHYNLIVPAVAALSMYALVSVDDRYSAPFIVLLWLGILSGIRLPNSEASIRLLRYVAVIAAIALMIVTARHLTKTEFTESHVQWQVADALNKMGIKPGDKVASLGNSHAHFWARLARVQIVSEIPYSVIPYKKDQGDFWNTDRHVNPEMLDAFRSTGAKIIVTNSVPANVTVPEWERIPDTDYYVYQLSK